METTSTTHGMLSPAISVNSHTTPSNAQGQFQPVLPTTRVHQLKPGSQKEISLINYLDDQILQINRRYAKKFSEAGSGSDAGYKNFDEVVYDVNPLFDVVWTSGTRKCWPWFDCYLQIHKSPLLFSKMLYIIVQI